MGRIENMEEIFSTPEGRRCSFCDNPSSGYWLGNDVVKVCPSCAVDVLPKLIADAIHLPPPGGQTNPHCAASQQLERVRGVFWEGMSCRQSLAADRAATPAKRNFVVRRIGF